MTDHELSYNAATRRRKLDELFADQPYLSTTMMASRLHERLTDEEPLEQVTAVSFQDEEEVLVRLIEGRRRNILPSGSSIPAFDFEPRSPDNAYEKEAWSEQPVLTPYQEGPQRGWTRMELLVDFQTSPPQIRAVERTDISPEVMTVSEAARFLHVSASSVRMWARRGRLPCIRLGRLLRFRQTAILEWITAKEAASK